MTVLQNWTPNCSKLQKNIICIFESAHKVPLWFMYFLTLLQIPESWVCCSLHSYGWSFMYRFFNSLNKTLHSFKYFCLMGRIIQIQFSAYHSITYHSIARTVLPCVSEAINTVFLRWGCCSSLPAKWNDWFGIKSLKRASQTLPKDLRQAWKWGRFFKSRTVAGRAAENLQWCWPVGRDRLH